MEERAFYHKKTGVTLQAQTVHIFLHLLCKYGCYKGLGSLTINFCPADMEKIYFTKSFKILKWLQNITYLL